MNYLAVLNVAVNANLDNGRIGVPVFVRWTAAVAESKDVLKWQLAEMTACTSRWLAADLHRLYATGTEAQGHLSLALEYATGSSALVALTLAHDRPHVNLAVYGNDGAIYHKDFIVPIRDGNIAPHFATGNTESGLVQNALVCLQAIEESLTANRPVELNRSGGQP
jgi:hypothetical protein